MPFPLRSVLGLATVSGLFAAGASLAIDPAKPVAISDTEKRALRRLHHNAVEIFVDRPGFGMRRLEMNLEDVLTAPKSLAELYSPSQQASPEKPDPKADPKADKKPSHYAVKDLLAKQGGRFPTDDGKESWQLSKLHLVGLVKHKEPVVYLEDRNPMSKLDLLNPQKKPEPQVNLEDRNPKKRDEEPKAEKEIPTRALDAFEKTALEAIRGGESLKAQTSGKTLRVMAPIYAGKRCAACHDPGALLGGFSYELERVAYGAEKDGKRSIGDR